MKTVYDLKPHIDDRGTRKREGFPDLQSETDFWELYELTKPYSMVLIPGFWSVWNALRYIAARRILGDIVECGVFLGGIAIFAALAAERLGLEDRKVWMFDTFEGPPEAAPRAEDGVDETGKPNRRGRPVPSFHDAVADNIKRCDVRPGTCKMVAGPVEETLFKQPLPAHIALLRLDTDYYASTKIEMEVLYPRLVTGGVLTIDDYGLWEGSRRAVDESLAHSPLLLNRVGSAVRTAIKI